jgi:hypothetical protein
MQGGEKKGKGGGGRHGRRREGRESESESTLMSSSLVMISGLTVGNPVLGCSSSSTGMTLSELTWPHTKPNR